MKLAFLFFLSLLGGACKQTVTEKFSGNGPDSLLYKDGGLRQVVHYENKIRQGTFEEWYRDGSLKISGQYRNGKIDGRWESWHPNGMPQSLSQYNLGQKNGRFQSWYPDGTLREKALYRLDTLIGPMLSWHANGQMKEQKIFKSDFDVQTTLSWYPNGQTQRRVTFLSDENRHHIEEWFSNGQLKTTAQYQFHQLQGTYATWHKNGAPFIQANYSRGKLSGRYAWWTREGKLISRSDYRSGRLVFDSGIEQIQTLMDADKSQIPFQFLGFRWGMSRAEIRDNFVRLGGQIHSQTENTALGSIRAAGTGHTLAVTAVFNHWDELWRLDMEIRDIPREKFPAYSQWIETEIHFKLGRPLVEARKTGVGIRQTQKWGEFLSESQYHMNVKTRNPVVTAELAYNGLDGLIRLELKNHLMKVYAESGTMIVAGPYYSYHPES